MIPQSLSVVFLCLALASLPGAGGAILTVTPTPDGTPGVFGTIQSALDAAVDGDTVVLLDGTFRGPGNRDLDLQGKAITLRSASEDPLACVIDCEWMARGLTMENGEGPLSVVRGITFSRGSTVVRFQPPGEGGGMKIVGANPTIENCVFDRALSGKGGGIYLDHASPTLVGCRFTQCAVSMVCFIGDTPVPCGNGGGITCENFSSPQILGCAFEANDAQAQGGAIACSNRSNPLISACGFVSNTSQVGGALVCDFYSNPTIQECKFSANHAAHSGGAILQVYLHDDLGSQRIVNCAFDDNTAGVGFGGAITFQRAYFQGTSFPLPQLELDRCTFSGNVGAKGGAIQASNVSLRVSSCVFVENAATDQGGALWLLNSNPPNAYTLVNCTFLRNAAGDGAIRCAQLADLRVHNTILWDSAPQHVVQVDAATSFLDTCFVSGGWSGAGTGIHLEDPLFLDLEGGDIHLGVGSPCADAGKPELVPKDLVFDIDGELRSMGKRVDVGADERTFRPIRGK